jgi:Mg2+-importing ATPase
VTDAVLSAPGAAARSVADVLAALETTADGLSSAAAAERAARYGPNVLAVRKVTALDVFLRQIRNPLLVLLLAAAGISAATGGVTDSVIIAAIVVLSVGLGFLNEYRSEVAVAALHDGLHHEALVWRDGRATPIDVRGIVPGDVIELRVGDIVAADARVLEAEQLECDEAVLTGESMPVSKQVGPDATDRSDGAATASVFMGSVVHSGRGRAVVVAIGTATQFGKIAVGLSEQPAQTAFQVGLRAFSRLLVRVAGILTVSIFVVNVALGHGVLDALLFCLAIAIGITPQLLPAIVSVSLATGSRQLARRQVLVKRLVTIEDLGNIEILFTDKTGTLTEGAIAFRLALDHAGEPSPEAFRLGLICNEATAAGPGEAVGNTLDVALWAAPGADRSLIAGVERIAALPFDHDRQLASVLVHEPNGTTMIIVKGAPESVLSRCVDLPADAAATVDARFAEGARVVAVARRPAPGATTLAAADERDLEFVGLLTFVDPPKADAGASIAKLDRLGIVVKIITGDNGTVAAKVCQDIGLAVTGTLTGAELAAMDDDALSAAIATTTIFSRVSPDQKSRIIKIARRDGADVAFMGDGVNDAVALHAADVGISVDSATDVAKDAADIVLLARDLGVLADGVMEGRRIFANTLKYVLMATSSNFGNMFSAAGASIFLKFLPMLPSQILLNNLLYDVGQMAIPTDEVDPEVLARPAAWDIGFVRRFMIAFGPVSSLFDFATFFVMLKILHASHAEFRSGWFVESLATQTLVIFLIRTRRVPFWRSRPSRGMLIVPVVCALIGAVLPLSPLAHVLGFATLPLRFFLILFGMILTYLGLVEMAKVRFYARQDRPRRAPLTTAQRKDRRLHRRAHRFVAHTGPRRPATAGKRTKPVLP